MSAQTRSRLLIGWFLILIIINLTVYWDLHDHDFVSYDDPEYVVKNTHVHSLTAENIRWAFTATHASNWHPLTWISHMIDCQLYGVEKATGHHMTNLILHIINSILLFLLLTRMTGSIWRSGFVAALFAIHPLHVESVAWVAERKDVLSTLFWLLAIWAYVRYAERPGIARYLPVVLLFALGLMSKPMLVTLPLTLLLVDFWPLRRLKSGWNLIWEKIPLFAMSIASSVITCIAQERGHAVRSLEGFPISVRIENALVAYASYPIKMIFPRGLAVLYPHPHNTLPAWQVIGATLLLVYITVLSVRARNDRPYFTMGWFWYLITLVPVIGLVQVGLQSMADRYTYVPLIGIFIAIIWSFPEIIKEDAEMQRHANIGNISKKKRKKRASVSRQQPSDFAKATSDRSASSQQRVLIPITLACVVVILMICALTQVGYWQNSITLFTRAIEVTTGNYVAHTNLGEVLLKEDKLDEAKEHFAEAIRINPNSVQALNNLSDCLIKQGCVEEAMDYLQRASQLDRDSPEVHYNLGNALKTKGDFEGAVREYSKTIKLKPSFADAYNNLGLALATQGKTDEAVKCFSKAIQNKADLVEAYANMGNIYLDQNKPDEAINWLDKAIRIRPDFAAAHHNKAAALYFKGRYTQAWEEIELCREYGLDPNPHLIKLLSQKMPESR